MICLKYAATNTLGIELKERLKDLSIAFSVFDIASDSEILLEEGDTTIAGFERINLYIDELADELHSWHYCSC